MSKEKNTVSAATDVEKKRDEIKQMRDMISKSLAEIKLSLIKALEATNDDYSQIFKQIQRLERSDKEPIQIKHMAPRHIADLLDTSISQAVALQAGKKLSVVMDSTKLQKILSAPAATDAEAYQLYKNKKLLREQRERTRLESVWYSIYPPDRTPPEDIDVFRRWERFLFKSYGLSLEAHERALDDIAEGRQPSFES
ncbi:hypothetical protein [Halobacillus sp. KGW1]|uniref:hypothetical protein n=1 Tax=Halobacillus sp. KGW1 TaxID=1793726 RepID=UPI000782F7C2|nr:hypothetical protein [Halobacillus sp. KGW1]